MRLHTALFRRLLLILLFYAVVACSEVGNQRTYKIDVRKAYRVSPDLHLAQQLLFINTDSSTFFANKALHNSASRKDSAGIAMAKFVLAENMLIKGENDSALSNFSSSNSIAKHLQMDSLFILSLLKIGEIQYNWGNFDTAYYYFDKAKEQSRYVNFEKGKALSSQFLGKHYHSIGNTNLSLELYEHAESIARNLNDTALLVSVYCNLGKHYQTLGDLARALEYYLKAVKISTNINNKIILATTLNHLGNIYDELGEYTNAFKYHKEALQRRKEIKYTEGIAKSYNNLGEVWLNSQSPDSAIKYLAKSRDICLQIGYRKGITKATLNLGNIAWMNERYNKAKNYYTESLESARLSSYDKGIIKALIRMASVNIKERQYNRAISELNEAEILAIKSEMLREQSEVAYQKFLSYNALKEIERALQYHVQYTNFQALLNNIEKDRLITQLKLSFETEKQEKQNELLKKGNELKDWQLKRRYTLTLLLLTVLVFLAFVIFVQIRKSRTEKKINKKLTKLYKEISAKNRELSCLNKELSIANQDKDKFFSIISHELRNPLWWFRNMTEHLSNNFDSYSKDKIKKSILSLDESAKSAFHLTENILYWSRSKLDRINYNPTDIDFQKLIAENLRLFKNPLEQKNIQVNLSQLDSLCIYADRELINIVIRNLLSNALKFTPENGGISIIARQEDDNALIIVKDTGIGIDEHVMKKLFNPNLQYSSLGLLKEKGSGLGLLLCREFVELNKGKIWILNSNSEGTEIHLLLATSNKSIKKQSVI